MRRRVPTILCAHWEITATRHKRHASIRPGYKDDYTYFGSYQKTKLTAGVDGGYDFNTPIVVTVTYPQAKAANKVVVGFEMSYAKPVSYSIQVSADGKSWNTIGSETVIASDGTATLYFDGSGWNTPAVYDHATLIQGVRLNIYSMSQPYAHADVLQVGARLENDLSDFVVGYDSEMSLSSPSFIAPFGKASSNTASVKLSNIDGRFNTANPNSLYYGMIEKKVRFTLDLGVNATPEGGNQWEYIREFTMWTDTWGGQSSTEVDVSLKDSSVILQERTVPQLFLENYTVGGIVCLIMDMVGMSNYAYTRSEQDKGQVIPWYWPSDTNQASSPRWGRLMVNTTAPSTTTIWDELSALAEATQTALYFDEHDVLQIVGRKQMFGSGKAVNWNLDAIQNGEKLPDVVSADVSYDLATNQVEFTYKPSAFASDAAGLPRTEQVWQPTAEINNDIIPTNSASAGSTTVTLYGAPLVKDFKKTDSVFWVTQAYAFLWPYESDVNIEGECLHYKGKEYSYSVKEGTVDPRTGYITYSNMPQTKVIFSADEKAQCDAQTDPTYLYKNAFTGKFIVDKYPEDGKLKRGIFGSGTADHLVDSGAHYTSLLTSYDNQVFLPTGGLVTQKDGYITQYNQVTTNSHAWNTTYHLRKHESIVEPETENGSHTVWYGGKIRFSSNGVASTDTANWRLGGFYMAGDWGDAGYYLEITSTTQIDGWEKRQWRHELALIGMPGDAAAYQLEAVAVDPATGNPTTDPKGAKWAIADDLWYSVDISYEKVASDGNNVHITVYMNGVVAAVWVVPPNKQPTYTNQWRWGTHVRGPSTMDIEYVYAVADDISAPFSTPDTTNFLDLKNGGFTSGFLARNVRYNWKSINPSYRWPGGPVYFPQKIADTDLAFDEFGPVVHEIRTFDVAFDTSKVPVESSYLYNTNPLAMTLYYQSDAFGAEFMLANADRTNVVVNGSEDVATPSGSTQSVNWTMFIYGRPLYTAQNDRFLVKKDDAAIRRQGLIRTQFTSRYIQTDEMATEIGQWVLDLWADGVDSVDVQLFGNPLLQLGDLVTMNYPLKGMYPSSHKYFVVQIKNSFSNGYKTEVTLRRCKV
jgi:hypothetical protein